MKYTDPPRQAAPFNSANSYIAFCLVCQTLCWALGILPGTDTDLGRNTRQVTASCVECCVAEGFKAG